MTLQEFFSRENSWVQCSYSIYNEKFHTIQYCLLGGIHEVYGLHYLTIMNIIKKEIKSPITFWNDAKERTIEDVRNLVKKLNI